MISPLTQCILLFLFAKRKVLGKVTADHGCPELKWDSLLLLVTTGPSDRPFSYINTKHISLSVLNLIIHYEGGFLSIKSSNMLIFLLQVLAILYVGGDAAQEESRLLGTVENKVRTTKSSECTTPSSQ